METVTQNWAEFYRSRVNSERYTKHFRNKYKMFLQMILAQETREIFEAGCGIGSVSKQLTRYGISCSGIDLNADIVALANENLGEDIFKVGDMFDESYATDKLTVTHGVLEHFSDDLILKSAELYPNSVHYVPLDKYKIPSYGDERLLPYEFWLDLLHPKEWSLFNDGHDLTFRL